MMRRPRQKSPAHLDFIRSLPCLVCGDTTATEATHIRMGDRNVGKRATGMGEKPSDIWVLPLCGKCHRTQHRYGERTFWQNNFIDPFKKALALYVATGDHELGEQIVRWR